MGNELVKRDLDKVELAGMKVWANGRAAVVDTGASLKDVENGLHACVELSMKCDWWIGDIVNQAEAIFGEDYHAIESLVAERAGMSLDTIQRHKQTSQRYSINDRMPCEISKHRLVENLPKPERKRILKRVVDEGLTANEIRDILKAKKGEKKGLDKHQYMLAKWNIREKEIDMGSLYEMLSDKANRSFTKDEFEKLGLADMNDTSTVYVIMKKPIVDPEEPSGPLVQDEEEEDLTPSKTVQFEISEELVQQAIEIVLESKRASVSVLQRRMVLGYSRAAKLMDILEEQGIVGPPQDDGGAREVLIESVEPQGF